MAAGPEGLTRLHAPIGGSVGGLFDMAVTPDFRRLGIGTALIAALAGAAAGESAVHTVVLNATGQGRGLPTRRFQARRQGNHVVATVGYSQPDFLKSL